MPSIQLNNVSFAHASARPLLHEASVHLDEGWTGLVGANGSGKTTLLRLIAGELLPDTGSMSVSSAGRPLLCPQSVEYVTPAIEAFAHSYGATASRVRGRLNLDPATLARWESLSPGERKRWQIGAALAAQPDVLLLDEPTNHLDVEARRLLVDVLRRHSGVGIVVSHDRAFLGSLTTRTLRFHNGDLTLWRGPYDQARPDWLAAESEQVSAYTRARKEERKLRRRVADQRRKYEQSQAQHKRSLRRAGPKDKDARSMEKKGRAEGGASRAAQSLAVDRSHLARATQTAESFQFTKEPGSELFVDYEPAPKPWLAVLTRDRLSAGAHTVLTDLDVGLARDSRIRVAGPNGAGKSTLLLALRAAASIPSHRILHLPQEMSTTEQTDLLDALRSLAPRERGRVLALVAALGVDPDHLLITDAPSPGEARKLAMAFGLGTQAWLVMLDEPTNHLDLPSIERLQAALEAYPGALVLVTHDDALADACTTETWDVSADQLRIDHA